MFSDVGTDTKTAQMGRKI